MRFFTYAALAVIGILVLTGCEYNFVEKIQPIQESEQVQEKVVPEGDLIAEVQLSEESDPAETWQEYEGENLTFKYPLNWLVEITAGDIDEAAHYIVLKNTSKDIILGGIAPSDYYLEEEGSKTINLAKYADEYVLITLEIYSGYEGKDWSFFLDDVYSGLITEFEEYKIPANPELQAIVAKRVTGLFSGQPRIFIRQDDNVYDVALQYRKTEKLDAEKVFNTFLQGFNF